ncbi:MAG: class I SAM-dependent methyltransferase [Bdellovibrionota bacterium]
MPETPKTNMVFDQLATAYGSARPEYPERTASFLLEKLKVAQSVKVLDLAAGTGKFTRHVLRYTSNATAADLSPKMLEQLSQRFPSTEVVQASAEEMPFPAQTFDVVVCANAFHWFATQKSLAEIARVLKPRGSLGLIWTVLDENHDSIRSLLSQVGYHAKNIPRFQSNEWKHCFEQTDLFTSLREKMFRSAQEYTSKTLINFLNTMSFWAEKSESEQRLQAEQVMKDLPRLFKVPSSASKISLRFLTHVYWCKKI